MHSPKQYIYFSFIKNKSPEQIDAMTGGLSQIILMVSIDKFFDEEFYQTVVNSSSLWVMDHECFMHVVNQSEMHKIAALPELMVWVDENTPAVFYEKELPENITFIKHLHPDSLFRLQLKQGLKKAIKNSERNLEHERYNSLFVNSIQAKLILDPRTGKILDANVSATKMYEKEMSQILDKNISMVHPESFDVLCNNMTQVLEGENFSVKLKILDSNRHLRELQYNLSLIILSGKKLILVNVDDITEKGQAMSFFISNHKCFAILLSPLMIYFSHLTEMVISLSIISQQVGLI
jgi:PAS domain S-box-containing protein